MDSSFRTYTGSQYYGNTLLTYQHLVGQADERINKTTPDSRTGETRVSGKFHVIESLSGH
jgi:hypothetical protein